MKIILIIVAGHFSSPEECEAAKRRLDIPAAEIVRYDCRVISGPAPKSAPLPPRKPRVRA